MKRAPASSSCQFSGCASQMRADHGERDGGLLEWQRLRDSVSYGIGSRACEQRLDPRAQHGQPMIRAARRDQRDAGRQTVAATQARHGQRAQIEQVDEVGVVARAGCSVRSGWPARRRSTDASAWSARSGRRWFRTALIGVALQIGERVLTVEGIDGAEVIRLADHRRHDRDRSPRDASRRSRRARRGARRPTGRRRATPRPALSGAKSTAVSRSQMRRSSVSSVGGKRAACRGVAEKFERVRHADPRGAACSRPGRGQLARVAVERIERGDLLRARARRRRRRARRSDSVSRLRHAGTTPRLLTSPSDGLRPDQPVEARRHAAGPGCVGAERERDAPGRHRDRRSGTRTARHVRGETRPDAPRRTANACRRGRSRTDRDWSCRSGSRRRRADAARRTPTRRACRRKVRKRRWSASRRRRCCP